MITELIARVRSLVRGTLRTQRVDADLKEEFRLHMELRAADLVKAGMAPADAARSCMCRRNSSCRSASTRRVRSVPRMRDRSLAVSSVIIAFAPA